MRRLLGPKLNTSPSFLAAFMRAGYYLDDLVLRPVNGLGTPERKRCHRESVPSLAERLRTYRPLAVVSFMKAIAPAVRDACTLAELPCPQYAVSFPGNGRQADFRNEMNAILPRLP